MTTSEIDDKPIKCKHLNNDILGQKNKCLSIPICIYIKYDEVEISKTLDKYSIFDTIR